MILLLIPRNKKDKNVPNFVDPLQNHNKLTRTHYNPFRNLIPTL